MDNGLGLGECFDYFHFETDADTVRWKVDLHRTFPSFGPLNPERWFGDCPDVPVSDDAEACYVKADVCEPYAWPGGYSILYLACTHNAYHRHEKVLCAKCATRMNRDARTHRGEFSGTYADTLDRMIASTYDEGPPLECEGDGCDAVIESSYGDPADCDECDGTGKRKSNPTKDCRECDGTGRKEDE